MGQEKENKYPNGAPPNFHYWKEAPVPPEDYPLGKAYGPGRLKEVKLLQCQRCQLGITVYAEETFNRSNLPTQAKCGPVHLRRDCSNEPAYGGSEMFRAACGFNYLWQTPRMEEQIYHVLKFSLEARHQSPGRLPTYRRVNCPDCLYPTGQQEEPGPTPPSDKR